MQKHNQAQSFQKLTLVLFILILSGCSPSAARLNKQGNQAFEKQDYNSALEAYQKSSQKADNSSVPDYNQGNTYLRSGQPDAAASIFQRALTNAGEELAQHIYYNLGNLRFTQKQFESAIENYKEALRIDAQDMDAKYNLELAMQQLQQQEQQQEQENKQQQQEQQPAQDEQQPDSSQQDQNSNEEQDKSQEENQQGASDENKQDEQRSPEENNETQSQEQPQPQDGELSEEQAKQLLDAASQDTQSLQQYLQQIFNSPGEASEKDW